MPEPTLATLHELKPPETAGRLASLRRIRCELRALLGLRPHWRGHRNGGRSPEFDGDFCQDCGEVLELFFRGRCRHCGQDLSRGWWSSCAALEGDGGHVIWSIAGRGRWRA